MLKFMSSAHRDCLTRDLLRQFIAWLAQRNKVCKQATDRMKTGLLQCAF